jgi:hypothetical protein
MGPRAYLLALGLAALLNAAQAAFGQSAPWCVWCADDPQTSDAGHYGYGNQHCGVTMSGLGVCVPGPLASARNQGVFIERRY